MEQRRKHRDELTPLLDAVFEQDTTANWLRKLQGALPAAPVDALPDRYFASIAWTMRRSSAISACCASIVLRCF